MSAFINRRVWEEERDRMCLCVCVCACVMVCVGGGDHFQEEVQRGRVCVCVLLSDFLVDRVYPVKMHTLSGSCVCCPLTS